MQLDIATLIAAAALVTALCAGARVLLWRMHPELPGTAQWALASGLGAAALAFTAIQGQELDRYSAALIQGLIVGGFVITWYGFRRFIGAAALRSWAVVLAVTAVVAPVAVAVISDSMEPRLTSNATIIALVSTLIARDLLSATGGTRVATRVTGLVYAVNAAVFAFRAISLAIGGELPSPWSLDQLAAFPILWWLCNVVAVTLGMILMIGERLRQELDQLASCDPLTGAFNRRAFHIVAEKELARARRYGQPLTVLMMDLDRFKRINDRLGHAFGDDVLRRFVAVANKILRTEDLLCRFGGEEFVALLPGTAAEPALAVAERIRTAFEAESKAVSHPEHQQSALLSVSAGISDLQPGEGIEEMIRRADSALYQAKASGRNRCEVAAVEPVLAPAGAVI